MLYKTDMIPAPKILQSSEKEIKQVQKCVNDIFFTQKKLIMI